MNKKDQVIKRLYKLASKQRELLKKAQVAPTALESKHFGASQEERSIFNRIDPAHKGSVMDLKVENGVVKVKFKDGMGSDAAFNAIQSAVTEAAELNELPRTNYQIQEVL